MRIFYSITLFLFLGFSSFAQTNPEIQGTIDKTGPLQVTISAKPTVTGVTPTSASATAMNIGLRLPKGSLVSPPVITLASLIGGSFDNASPVGTEDGFGNYVYETVLNAASFPTLLVEQVAALYTATFDPTATGKFVSLIDDPNSNNAFFDIVIPGYPISVDPDTKFFGGGVVDNVSGGVSSVTAASPLPIKLTKFVVAKLGDKRASDLRWTSQSEINADFFGIERSENGINFEAIAQMDTKGGAYQIADYQFIDNKLPIARSAQSIFYYRLKMVDLDGSFEYSEIRSVRFDESNQIDITYYPNPTSQKVNLKMSVPSYDNLQETNAQIFDLSGKLLMTKKASTNGVTEIDLSNLPNAIYNIQVEHNGQVFTNRIIKTN